MSLLGRNTFSFIHLCRFLKQALLNHFQQLLLDFDPVKDGRKLGVTKEELLYSKLQKQNSLSEQDNRTSKMNFTYILPALSMLAISLESEYIYLKASYRRQPKLLNNLIARRIFPSSLWKQSDVMMQIAHFLTTTIFLCLLLAPKLEPKFVMYIFHRKQDNNDEVVEIVQNGRLLGKAETLLIARYRTQMNRFIRWIMFVLFLLLAAFFGSSFWQNAQTHQLDNRTFLLKLVELGFICLYLPITNVFMILFFMLVVRYIRIKQQCLRERILKLEALAADLERAEFQHSYKQKMFRLWNAFKVLNVHLTGVHEEIRGQNRVLKKEKSFAPLLKSTTFSSTFYRYGAST